MNYVFFWKRIGIIIITPMDFVKRGKERIRVEAGGRERE